MKNFDISVQRFDEFAEEYAARFDNVSPYLVHLEYFCDQISINNPAILELACGPGNVTRYLKNRFPGSRILAVDLAPRMIEIAQKALPEVEFRLMDVRHIDGIAEKFDAVMCSFCLPFLSKSDAAQLISDCSKILNSGGVLYLSTMEGDENRAGFENTSFSGNDPIYFILYRQDELERAFVENGFELLGIKLQDYLEPDGSLTTDMIFIASRK